MPGPILSSSSETTKPRSRPGTESLANSLMPIVENEESNCSLDFSGGRESDGRMFCRRN